MAICTVLLNWPETTGKICKNGQVWPAGLPLPGSGMVPDHPRLSRELN